MARWRPGESGNPEGRQKGQRTKIWALRDAIHEAVAELGDEFGEPGGLNGFVKSLLRRVADSDPATLLRVLVSLLPKKIEAGLDAAAFHAELLAITQEQDRLTIPGAFPDSGDDGNDGGGNGSGIEP